MFSLFLVWYVDIDRWYVDIRIDIGIGIGIDIGIVLIIDDILKIADIEYLLVTPSHIH